ncbi:hypothetical protein BH09ACT13_BH09ACT13_10620 [soil metagenome]
MPVGRLLVATGIALFLAACGGEEEARPDLAFVSTRDGDYAIFEMNSDGKAERRLTDANPDTSSPAGLFFQIEPAWSPDGTRIAFSSRRAGTFDIYVLNADGTGTRLLTSTKENDSHPTWSPEGNQIAFARSGSGDIYVMNADGSDIRRILDPLAEEADPAWSPDGAWIAYVRKTPDSLVQEVWLARPDGSERHALTSQAAKTFTPAWSPDSKRIAFATNVGDTQFDIYTIGVDGKGLRRLTVSKDDTFEPSWSPDGTTIAYSEGGAIYLTDAAGEAADRITDGANNDSSPVWNPVPAGEEE